VILIAATIFVGGATQQGVQPLSTPIGLSVAVKNRSNQYDTFEVEQTDIIARVGGGFEVGEDIRLPNRSRLPAQEYQINYYFAKCSFRNCDFGNREFGNRGFYLFGVYFS
jgi:hypothetical protein